MDVQDPLKACSAPIGGRGGSRSHRTLPSAEARDRVREARRAFRDYHAQYRDARDRAAVRESGSRGRHRGVGWASS